MALYDLQVIFHHDSGLPKDSFVNTLHYDMAINADIQANCDEIMAKYELFKNQMSSVIASATVKVYESGPNPGGPTFQKDYVFSPVGSPSPSEVAICLSYAATETHDASLPRRRGRIYLGPLAGSSLGAERPSPTLRDAVLDLGEGLAQVGDSTVTTWKLYSRTDNAYHTIESISVDNSWDTQRRRGAAATLREERDVQ